MSCIRGREDEWNDNSKKGTLLDNTFDESSLGSSNDDFSELTNSYKRVLSKWSNSRKKYTNKTNVEYKMDKPVKCHYHETNSIGDPIEKIMLDDEQEVFPEQLKRSDRYIPVQYRGITLRQLRGIWALVERRCEKESWKDRDNKLLTLESITSHDVNTHVVKPFTEETNKSFVESLPSTAGYQRPRILVSSTFALPFKDLLACVEAFFHDFRTNSSYDHNEKGGGMTEDTPVWVWLFARNPSYEKLYPNDPRQTPFAKAMEAAQYRVLSISGKDGIYFTRTWPLFETIMALKKGRWYVYTPHKHTHKGCEKEAVGLIDGGATSDTLAMDTLEREQNFPTDLILKCFEFRIQDATAQEPRDRNNVLKWSINNAIINKESTVPTQIMRLREDILQSENNPVEKNFSKQSEKSRVIADHGGLLDYDDDVVAPDSHTEYDLINDHFRAHFTTTGTLQSALLKDELCWNKMLEIMRKGNMKQIRLNFEKGKRWDALTEDEAVNLINSLPNTIENLEIQCADFNSKFIIALGKWVRVSKLRKLHLVDTLSNQNIDHDTIVEFAYALEEVKDTLEDLQIWRGNEDFMNKNEDFESIVTKKDLKIVEIILETGNIAKALFTPLNELYQDNNPDFYKIAFLHTVFMSLNRSLSVDLSEETIQLTLDWASYLDESRFKKLLQTKAGSFVKATLNHKFESRGNVFVTMLNSYVQMIIVTIVCLLNEGIKSDFWFDVCVGVLIVCLGWIFLKELLQMSSTFLKKYVTDVKNMVDILQIGVVAWMVKVMIREGDSNTRANESVYALLISWVALIFELSYMNYTLATFMTATIEILKGLFPFLFTAILVNLMFAHAFRAKYIEETCYNVDVDTPPCQDVDTPPFQDGWKMECSSILESYSRAITMSLTDSHWNFDDKPGVGLMFLYAFVMGILLLNIVIAVVSNKFTEVQGNAKSVFYYHRCSVLNETSSILWIFHKISGRRGDRRRGSGKSGRSIELYSSLLKNKSTAMNTAESEEKQDSLLCEQRISFQWTGSYSQVKGIRNLKEKCRIKALKEVVDWWFNPYDLDNYPCFSTRMKVFYMYSVWEDIIFPGFVFERMLLGLKYNVKMRYGALHPWSRFLRVVSGLIFMCNILVMIIIFICGLISFGLLWPKVMKEYLFHEYETGIIEQKEDIEKVKHELRYMKKVMKKVETNLGCLIDREFDDMKFSLNQGN